MRLTGEIDQHADPNAFCTHQNCFHGLSSTAFRKAWFGLTFAVCSSGTKINLTIIVCIQQIQRSVIQAIGNCVFKTDAGIC